MILLWGLIKMPIIFEPDQKPKLEADYEFERSINLFMELRRDKNDR